MQNGTTNGGSAYTAQASTTGQQDQWSFLPELPQRIVRFILSQDNRDQGIHINAIVRAVHGEDAASIGFVRIGFIPR